MIDVKTLEHFAEVKTRIADPVTLIVVQLLVMEAYTKGQLDGLARGEAVGQAALNELGAKMLLLTRSGNQDRNT